MRTNQKSMGYDQKIVGTHPKIMGFDQQIVGNTVSFKTNIPSGLLKQFSLFETCTCCKIICLDITSGLPGYDFYLHDYYLYKYGTVTAFP